jgi:hypothetical protein
VVVSPGGGHLLVGRWFASGVSDSALAFELVEPDARFTGADDLVFSNEVGEHICGLDAAPPLLRRARRRRSAPAPVARSAPLLRDHRRPAAPTADRPGLPRARAHKHHDALRPPHSRGPRRGAPLRGDPGRDGADLGTRSGHARRQECFAYGRNDATEPNQEEAPTGIEPVTSSAHAVEPNLWAWIERRAVSAVALYRPLFVSGDVA